MACEQHNNFHHSRVFLLSILFVLPVLLLGLNAKTVDSNLRDTLVTQSQCMASVGKCLSSCAWQISDIQETPCQQPSSSMMHALWSAYENIAQRLDGLDVPLQKLQDLPVLIEGINELRNKTETLTTAQKDREQVMQSEKQLGECKETLQNSESEMNLLRRLAREQFSESDVVNAARDNDPEKLRGLLDAGFAVDSRDKDRFNNTPLHAAAGRGYLDMIRFLVQRGAPLEAKNTNGHTPFMDATIHMHIPAAQLLVDLGANPLARGTQGTARDLATLFKHSEIVDWLKQKGW